MDVDVTVVHGKPLLPKPLFKMGHSFLDQVSISFSKHQTSWGRVCKEHGRTGSITDRPVTPRVRPVGGTRGRGVGYAGYRPCSEVAVPVVIRVYQFAAQHVGQAGNTGCPRGCLPALPYYVPEDFILV